MSPEHTIKQGELVTRVNAINHAYSNVDGEITDTDGESYSYWETSEDLDYENIKEVSEATFVNSSNSQSVAKRIYEYYQYRLSHSLKIILGNEKAGNMSALQVKDGFVPLLITSMDIDLTGGFLAKVNGIGNALKLESKVYAKAGTPEIYAGDGATL